MPAPTLSPELAQKADRINAVLVAGGQKALPADRAENLRYALATCADHWAVRELRMKPGFDFLMIDYSAWEAAQASQARAA